MNPSLIFLSEIRNMQINIACIIVPAAANIERGVFEPMPAKSDVVSGVTIILGGGDTGGVRI